ncbi:uncharacterized protein METZ01_LOCUS453013, partial [marine metagenome]
MKFRIRIGERMFLVGTLHCFRRRSYRSESGEQYFSMMHTRFCSNPLRIGLHGLTAIR